MNTETTSDRRDMRAILAEITLATELPVPETIRFMTDDGILFLALATVADGQEWSRHLGGGATNTYVNTDGHRYLGHGVITWHGWRVSLHASEPTGSQGTRLPDDTAARLSELANA